ncbi:hypothetical protein PAMP_007864 [Pampus punctatissimus]
MMTGKSVKDVDRYQAVLNSLLALEENKFCADCESKGPRWASWNLGIFICIRCAGIHRNLGVHISKVKSVNLDQWTQEQVQCVQEMGNAKAKRLYEAFLPECFQRPETDQSAEIFIRDKYDKKKYIDKVIDIQMLRKEKSCDNIPKEPVVFEKMKLKKEVSPKTVSQSVTDLLGLAKAKEGTVKKLSKDSILSLYASTPSVHASSMATHAGLYMNQMGYPTHPYGSYHSLAQAGGMGGTMMTSQMAMMGQQQSGMIGVQQNSMMGQQNGLLGAQGVMAQPSSAVAPIYMTQGMMGQQQSGMMVPQQNSIMGQHQSAMMMQQQQSGMMGHQQVGGLTSLPQQPVYGVHQAQQLQWNITQVTQHMAGMNLYNTKGMMGYSSQQMGESTNPSSVHMTEHVWK